MPRGRKKSINSTDQIAELEASIAALRAELKRQESALKLARERQTQEEMTRLYEAIQARHLNVDEVLALLDDPKTEEAFTPSAPLQLLAN